MLDSKEESESTKKVIKNDLKNYVVPEIPEFKGGIKKPKQPEKKQLNIKNFEVGDESKDDKTKKTPKLTQRSVSLLKHLKSKPRGVTELGRTYFVLEKIDERRDIYKCFIPEETSPEPSSPSVTFEDDQNVSEIKKPDVKSSKKETSFDVNKVANAILKIEVHNKDTTRGFNQLKHEASTHRLLCRDAFKKRLGRKNIVEYIEDFFYEEKQFILMEYCKGGDLLTYMKESFQDHLMPLQTCREIFVDVLQGLHYMHGLDIAHRDLKPENIVLEFDIYERRYIAKLCDFGFSIKSNKCIHHCKSKYIDYHWVDMVKDGCGTLNYVPPEILNNEAHNVFHSDIWYLGATFYTILNGKMPFYGMRSKIYSELSPDMALRHTAKRISVLDLNEFTPYRMSSLSKTLLFKMLNLEPSCRFTTKELLQDPWVVGKFLEEDDNNPMKSVSAIISYHPQLSNSKDPNYAKNIGLREVSQPSSASCTSDSSETITSCSDSLVCTPDIAIKNLKLLGDSDSDYDHCEPFERAMKLGMQHIVQYSDPCESEEETPISERSESTDVNTGESFKKNEKEKPKKRTRKFFSFLKNKKKNNE